jgi:hypothetical protein
MVAGAQEPYPRERHTWLSGAWIGLVIGVVALALIFILRSLYSGKLYVLAFHHQLPLDGLLPRQS